MSYIATSAREKIKRAKHHLSELNAQFQRLNESHPYEIRSEIDVEAGSKSLVYYPSSGLDPEWPVRLGELLYDLRSALDHVVFDLGPAHRSEFPIFDDRSVFYETDKKTRTVPTKRSGLYKMRGITNPRTRAIIEGVQPFNCGHGERPDLFSVLWLLSELCNIDKHRTLNLCRRESQSVRVEWIRDVSLAKTEFLLASKAPLEERAVLLTYWPETLNEEVDVKAQLTFYIALDEGQLPGIAGEPVTRVCGALAAEVERVVEMIELSVG